MSKVLWMVNHYAGLPRDPTGTRHYWLSQGLQDLGWDVRLIRSGPTPSNRPWRPLVEDVDGVEVTTLPGPQTQVRGVTRLRSWAAFSGSLQHPGSTGHLPKPDVVLGSTVHLGAAWAAHRLARRHSAPFVFEVRDLWPETLIALGALKRNSVPAKALLRIERSLARSAALIVSPLSGVGDYMLHHHGIPSDRFLWVSNGVHMGNYSELPPPPETDLRVQYFGAIGTANDVASIVDAVKLANQVLDEPVQLQIRGSGASRANLVARVTDDSELASTIEFLEPVPSHQVPAAMAWGNSLVLTVRDLPELYRYGISMNKLFDYLASGRWIVMGSHVEANPIADAPGLTLCDPTAASLSSAMVQVARLNGHQRNRIASGNATLAGNRFDYRVLASDLAAALEPLIARTPGPAG